MIRRTLFTASNGARVQYSETNGLTVVQDDSLPNTVIATDAHLNALREYFLHEDRMEKHRFKGNWEN